MAVNHYQGARAALYDPSLPAMLRRLAQSHPGRPILRRQEGTAWRAIAWADLAARVEEATLATRMVGLGAGQVGCLLSAARVECVEAEFGLLSLGAIVAAIDPAAAAARVGAMLRITGATLIFVEDALQLGKVLAVRETCPALRRIVVFDAASVETLDDPMCQSFEDFMTMGAEQARFLPGLWPAFVAARGPEETALLVDAGWSGTAPQLAMLSHRAVLSQAAQCALMLGQKASDTRLAMAPLSDMVEHVQGLFQSLVSETETWFAADPSRALSAVRPSVLVASSGRWAGLLAQTRATEEGGGWLRRAWRRGLARLTGQGLAGLRLAVVGDPLPVPEIVRDAALRGVALHQLVGPPAAAGVLAWAAPG
ncbi:MAG: AMP-binding protein, partial [Rhodospirillales bacterium]|nr:AMP-binding protein [Rhodospirillales bacterium]